MPRDKGEERGGSGKGRSGAGKVWRGARWVAGSSLRAVALGEIVSSGRFIGSLIERLRGGSRFESRLRVGYDRRFDLEATAFSFGISIEKLEDWLLSRRGETARTAYLSFGLGWLFFVGWVYRAATMKWTAGNLLPVVEFAPFCLAFFLMAFRSALVNFQIRTLRLASAREYLLTSDFFWPR